MATQTSKEDEVAPIPLSVPADLSGNGGTLDELQRQLSYRSQREGGLGRRLTEGSNEKERDVEPERPADEEDVHEDDRASAELSPRGLLTWQSS
jgi:hypothetical protein